MINHARTLLLNIFAQSANAQDAGYEYIPPTFKPLVLPNTLRVIRGVLFGSRPDQRFLNLRARELLSYIHQTELAEYVYKLDPRVTYWPEEQTTAFKYQPRIRVQQALGAERSLGISGEFVVSNAGGKANRLFRVQLTNRGGAGPCIAVTDEKDSTVNLVTPISGQTNLPAITLPETQVKFRINDAQTALPALAEISGEWVIALSANPPPALTTLLPTLELLGEPVFLDLFGVEDSAPYATFKNVWFDHPLPAYRLAGLVLALIYRAEEVRTLTDG
jgi:hypothetical protein